MVTDCRTYWHYGSPFCRTAKSVFCHFPYGCLFVYLEKGWTFVTSYLKRRKRSVMKGESRINLSLKSSDFIYGRPLKTSCHKMMYRIVLRHILRWIVQRLYKLCLPMHLIHTSQAPSYLTDIVTQTASVTSRTRLRSGSSLRYEQPRTRLSLDNERFPTLH